METQSVGNCWNPPFDPSHGAWQPRVAFLAGPPTPPHPILQHSSSRSHRGLGGMPPDHTGTKKPDTGRLLLRRVFVSFRSWTSKWPSRHPKVALSRRAKRLSLSLSLPSVPFYMLKRSSLGEPGRSHGNKLGGSFCLASGGKNLVGCSLLFGGCNGSSRHAGPYTAELPRLGSESLRGKKRGMKGRGGRRKGKRKRERWEVGGKGGGGPQRERRRLNSSAGSSKARETRPAWLSCVQRECEDKTALL